MDTRKAFVHTAENILHGFIELSSYRIIGMTVQTALETLNTYDKKAHENSESKVINILKEIGLIEYSVFKRVFNETSVILAYSWLESFLMELEETLYLNDPNSIGESIQVKLGKILSVSSIDELIKDIAANRIKEKSKWGLKNRILDLKENHKFNISLSEKDIQQISSTRNEFIHGKNLGNLVIEKGKLSYKKGRQKTPLKHDEYKRILSNIFKLLKELYIQGARELGIPARNKAHIANLKLIKQFDGIWAPTS